MNTSPTYQSRLPVKLWFDTFGGLAVSSLLICILSGIVLAIPYDINDPYLSISQFLLYNPGAVLARNIHYWSAQFFLVFSLIHIWDHIRIGSDRFMRYGIWFRLIISVFVILFVMLSGFILKGDHDSRQAMLIFRSLFEEIPLAGKYLAYVLLGNGDNMLILYINHIAPASIFIFVILFEHSRIIWGRGVTFLILTILFFILAIFFQAPLQFEESNIMKGPWYFLGLQELLHWMKNPGWIWIITLLITLPFLLLPLLKENTARLVKYVMFLLLIVYAILTIIGYFFRGEEWRWRWNPSESHMPFTYTPVSLSPPVATFPMEIGSYGRAESCMLCHDGMQGFSPAHSPESVGCVSCHLGNPFVSDKDQAHKDMLRVPGNLDNASRSCGTSACHPEIVARINTSLMTTMSGIIAVDRFVFNEIDSPDALFNVGDIAHSPADQHLRNMCSRCHLGNTKHIPAPVHEGSRGGGCNACHLNYSDEAKQELEKYFGTEMPDSSLWKAHPSLDLNIGDEHCFGCHSRSGRISTSYEGWHETLLKEKDIIESDTFRILDDGRVFRYLSEDVHHKAGMQCIDCHDSYELMGDGKLYMHQEDQVMISCEDCHFTQMPLLLGREKLDYESEKILKLKNLENYNGKFLPLGQSGRLIWNAQVDSVGQAFLLGKNSGHRHPLNPPKDICRRGTAHDELSCQSCHTSWIPQCIGCHNEYDPNVAGYDMIKQAEEDGSWVEFVGLYLAGRPALGVVEGDERKVHTFTPGMILTIDKSSYDPDLEDPEIFHRLYAPLSAHTTSSDGRSCRSCHNDPLAIGYGYGKLTYKIDGKHGAWVFSPRFAANKNDGLPEDAWIPFLTEPDGRHSTRTNTRPFSLKEQQRILLVGACLNCHDEDSQIMLESLDKFDALVQRRSKECVIPGY